MGDVFSTIKKRNPEPLQLCFMLALFVSIYAGVGYVNANVFLKKLASKMHNRQRLIK